ncbi:hypothetical protein EVAR_1012_1 [Eumeta japonica]|uniref:RNA-directed DNA polymerase from mobile element jockey n=1 Tax=Eumeta variegata TaxID=151549 RepID=A0A4C1SEE4_EUMVA|nr:hypothetical protein EVAR_1012_1 [Eumeta japonica]
MGYRGTAVMVKKDIMHEAIEKTSFRFVFVRTLGMQVGSAEEEMSIFATYRRPGSPLHVQDIHTLLNSHTLTLISGDHNAKRRLLSGIPLSKQGWEISCGGR